MLHQPLNHTPCAINHVKHSAPTLSNTYVINEDIIMNVHMLIYACQTHSMYILLTSQVGHSRGYSMCHLQLTLGIQTIHVTLQEQIHTHDHYIRRQLRRLCVRLVINTKESTPMCRGARVKTISLQLMFFTPTNY